MNIYCYGMVCCVSFVSALPVTLGIESITKHMVESHAKKKDPAVGLVTNQTGTVGNCVLSVDILKRKNINVLTIFAPEHGYWGTVPAGIAVPTVTDSKTGILISSLYEHGKGKTITQKQLEGIDLVLFDMQECGMRHFTYISTLYKVMEACKIYKVPLIVCDRPNPLGGIMEGPLVEPALQSFISIAPIPLRHGLTIAELALYFNKYVMNNKVLLKVIPMKNYKRKKQDFVFYAPLSPNLKTLNAVYGYSFLGLIGEIKPFDVGVGTDFAFERIGLPTSIKNASLFINRLEKECKKMKILVQHVHYTNQKKEPCIGLQCNFKYTKQWSTIKLVLAILEEAQKAGISLTFSSSFDKAFGSNGLQKMVKNNTGRLFFLNDMYKQLCQFYRTAKNCYLYKPIHIFIE